MDKQSFSRYGGIVIVVIILAMMIAFATPFGSFVVDGVKNVLANFSSTGGNTIDNNYDDIVNFPYPGSGSGSGGNQGSGSSGGNGGSETVTAGLYETGSNYTVMLTSWDDLLADGTVHVENGVIYTNVDINTGANSSSAALAGDLMLPADGTITALGDFEVNLITYEVSGNAAFFGCSNLTGVVIPASVTSIGGAAFSCCTVLKTVTFGENSQLTSIGDEAFGSCISLTSVGPVGSGASVEIPNSVTVISDGMFFSCTGLASVIIPDNITLIDHNAFDSCTSLTSVIIPDEVTTIGIHAFSYCSNLTTVTFGENSQLTSIGDHAFCLTNLTSITIPDGVTVIDADTFNSCTNLESVVIPASVTAIEWGAFSGCTNLNTIKFEGTVAQWNAITFGAANWNANVPATTVTCSDGTVALS